jgi:hypothetical protein
MMVREAVYAQQGWYPLGRDACIRAIEAMQVQPAPADLPERPVAGVVPHAGWTFSGATALSVVKAIAGRRQPKTFVLFGPSHRVHLRASAMFSSGAWQTPLGTAEVDERLAREILSRAGPLLTDDPNPHVPEHSLEIQVPFIQYAVPGARIVPILVPPSRETVDLGRIVGQAIRALEADAVCLGSSDLTHYGPMYGFTPLGQGPAALRWVRDENDRRMMDVMVRLDAESAVPTAQQHMNACGAGAIAATLSAARELGATRGCVIHYTTSYDVMRQTMGRTDYQAAVGYGGVVF